MASDKPARPRRGTALAVVAVVLFAGGLTTGLLLRGSGSPSGNGPRTIDMRAATGLSCLAPARGRTGNREVVLSQLFRVKDSKGHAYLLGWQLAPYVGSQRTYRFKHLGNLLALEPATGGRPLGYGAGTLRVFGAADAGSVAATVTLTHGGTVRISGDWTCPGSGSTR